MNDLTEIFGAPISTYTRADALADGFLIDISTVAREAGITFPTAITAAAWADCVAWDKSDNARKGTVNDEAGRLWDVVWMLKCAIGRSSGGSILNYSLLRVPREGRGRQPRLTSLKSICGPGDTAAPVITIMLPHED